MAAHVAAEAERFNCKKCPWGSNEKGKHCDDSNPAPYPKFAIHIDGVPYLESRTCFLPQITPQSHKFLRLHLHYRKHFLPLSGGIFDQPNVVIEAMELLERTFDEIELQRAKDRARKAGAS